MYIKDDEYENIAYTVIRNFLDDAKKIIEAGKNPAKWNVDKAMDRYIPERYSDEECEKRSNSIHNYWTKHNTAKLKKYIKTEITRRKLVFALNIGHIKEEVTKNRMKNAINILSV